MNILSYYRECCINAQEFGYLFATLRDFHKHLQESLRHFDYDKCVFLMHRHKNGTEKDLRLTRRDSSVPGIVYAERGSRGVCR